MTSMGITEMSSPCIRSLQIELQMHLTSRGSSLKAADCPTAVASRESIIPACPVQMRTISHTIPAVDAGGTVAWRGTDSMPLYPDPRTGFHLALVPPGQ